MLIDFMSLFLYNLVGLKSSRIAVIGERDIKSLIAHLIVG
jgi:hypothetical protein